MTVYPGAAKFEVDWTCSFSEVVDTRICSVFLEKNVTPLKFVPATTILGR